MSTSAKNPTPPRAAPCNGNVLRFLREQRGLTQADLAARAGFSERLIVKAESGKSIANSTLAILAAALSDAGGSPVAPQDLTTDPLGLARRYTEALYTRPDDFVDAIRDFLDPDVEFLISGDPAQIPFAGHWRGVAEVERGFGIFFSLMQAPPDHNFDQHYHYIAQGNDVVVWGESYLHPKGQPSEKPMSVSNLMRFRGGKLYRFEDHYDTQWATTVLSG